MELFNQYIPTFLFILLRAGIVVSLFPLIGSKTAPTQFRIGLAVAAALVLTPVVPPVAYSREMIAPLVIREVLFGIAIGGTARFVFLAIDMAGQLMSNAMGLSIATVFNPEVGPSTEVAQLFGMIAMLVFLSTDAHHDLIALFVRSYELAPAGQIDAGVLVRSVITAGAGLFVIAVKISAPVVVVMLMTNLLLGFVAKAAPQMNVFFVGYPVYLFVGFLVMLLGVPVFVHEAGQSFARARDEILRMIAGAGR
jgi:flagellar biosynthetic protein FliR